MIGVPTTFVIGAGASQPYGLPVGKDLHGDARNLTPHHPAYELLLAVESSVHKDPETLVHKLSDFLKDLQKHPADSIDAFLRTRQTHPDAMRIGKSLIAALMGLAVMTKPRVARGQTGDWLGYVIDRMIKPASNWQEFSEASRSISIR